MYPTINNPIGESFFQNLLGNVSFNNPMTGRVFFVAKSGITNESEIKATYGSVFYPDGTPMLYTTLKLALASCLASRGDTIIIAPGHTESITNTTDLNVNIAGVTIVGLGVGTLRPKFTLTTATTAIITFSAANVQVRNIIIDGTGFAAVVSPVTVTAANVQFSNCLFINANATNQCGVMILTTAGADGLVIDSCYFQGTTDAGTTNALQLVGGNDIKITNNYFYGAYTTTLGPINNITTACLRLLIKNNTLINATASSTKAIVLVAGSTGIIQDNRIAILSGTAPVTAAGMYVSQNISVAAVSVGATQTQV